MKIILESLEDFIILAKKMGFKEVKQEVDDNVIKSSPKKQEHYPEAESQVKERMFAVCKFNLEDGKFVEEYNSIYKAAKENGITYVTLNKHLRLFGRYESKGFSYLRINRKDAERKVDILFDNEGWKTYETLYEAAKAIDARENHLLFSLDNNKTCNGHYVRWNNSELDSVLEEIEQSNKEPYKFLR